MCGQGGASASRAENSVTVEVIILPSKKKCGETVKINLRNIITGLNRFIGFWRDYTGRLAMRTRYIQLKDMKLAYRRMGSGKTLLLLHGNGESRDIFTEYQEVFFADYDTVAPDSRCHGESVFDPCPLTIESLSDDIAEFCRAAGIEEAFLIGYSDGANIALHLAKRAPHIFKRIALISPNVLVSGFKPATLLSMRLQRFFWRAAGLAGLDVRRRLMLLGLMLNDIGLSGEDLASLDVPVLLLYAERDVIKKSHIEDIALSIPGCRAVMIEGTDHYSILNDAATVNELRRFLTG